MLSGANVNIGEGSSLPIHRSHEAKILGTNIPSYKKKSSPYKAPYNSLPHRQQPTTIPHSEADEIRPLPLIGLLFDTHFKIHLCNYENQ
jgi:hypothetical protein